jgi:rhomboid-like protein
VGLPFRYGNKDLAPGEVVRIFGRGVEAKDGNALLRILHGRRVAGTLHDPAFQGYPFDVTQSQLKAAEAYLERTLPVDTVLNEGLRAEDELKAMGAAGSQQAGGSEATSDPMLEAAKILRQKSQQPLVASLRRRFANDDRTESPYARGMVDEWADRKRQQQEEKARMAEERKRKMEEEEAKAIPGLLTVTDPEQRAFMKLSPQMQKYHLQGVLDPKEDPIRDGSKWALLWPSYLFSAAFMVGLTYLAGLYEAPEKEARWFPGIPPAVETLALVIAANLAVSLVWRFPPLWKWANRYLLMAPGIIRPVTLLTAVFSHQDLLRHLGLTMLVLYIIGVRLHDDVGRAGFLEVYLASGVLGYACSLTKFVAFGQLTVPSLGGSGAMYGVVGAYFMLHKFDDFKLLFLPPDPWEGFPGLYWLAAVVALQLWALMNPLRRARYDIVNHLAGLAVGSAYGQHFYNKKREKRRAEKQTLVEAPAGK